MTDEIKIGARNSKDDAERLQKIHDLAAENGASCAKSMQTEEEVIYFGTAVKALGDGKVGGYLIRFSTANDPDLTGDYFTKDTNISIPDKLPTFYQHGFDPKLKRREIGKTITRVDEVGYWAETQLNLRDEYEKKLEELAKEGKLGYSSGALSHLVEREPVKDGVWFIKSWYVGEASLTPTPAEPRNSIVSLKSIDPENLALPIEGGNDKDEQHENLGVLEMTEQTVDIKAMVAEQVKAIEDEREAKAKAEADFAKKLEDAKLEGEKSAIENLKKQGYFRKNLYHSTDKAGDDNDGMQAFKAWMQTGQENHSLIEPDSVMQNMKAAYNITTGASGAYLVPDPLYEQIVAKRSLQSWVRQAPVSYFQTSADHILVPYEDTSATAMVSTAEAGTYDENEPTLGQKDISLTKYTKRILASEEFMMDNSSNWEAWIAQVIARSAAVLENTVATTNVLDGSGATAATAAATSNAVTAAELARLIGSVGAGYNVPAECGFLMKNVNKWYVKGLASYAFQFNSTPTAPDIFGYPIYVSDDMPAMTTGLYATVFGNWTMFGIADKRGIMVQRNPYLYMASGQIGIFASIFFGCDVLQSEAIYKMAQA